MDSELRMYILINSSIKMTPGKMISQAGHVVSMVTETMVKKYPSAWDRYRRDCQTKIVLKCPQLLMETVIARYSKEMNECVWCEHVLDAGRTQVEPNTLTAIAFCPMNKCDLPEILSDLKLL